MGMLAFAWFQSNPQTLFSWSKVQREPWLSLADVHLSISNGGWMRHYVSSDVVWSEVYDITSHVFWPEHLTWIILAFRSNFQFMGNTERNQHKKVTDIWREGYSVGKLTWLFHESVAQKKTGNCTILNNLMHIMIGCHMWPSIGFL